MCSIIQITVEEDMISSGEEAIVICGQFLWGITNFLLSGEAVWGIITVDKYEVSDKNLPVFVPGFYVALHGGKMSRTER